MNDLTGERIGFVVTGSFCTFSAAFAQAKLLREAGAELTPIFSEHAAAIDTRFGTAAERVAELEGSAANRRFAALHRQSRLAPGTCWICWWWHPVLPIPPQSWRTASRIPQRPWR